MLCASTSISLPVIDVVRFSFTMRITRAIASSSFFAASEIHDHGITDVQTAGNVYGRDGFHNLLIAADGIAAKVFAKIAV